MKIKIEKYSRQRETLLRVLRSTKCHPDADWIYTEVRKEIPNISLGTVYRNLSKLSNDGTIQKIVVGDGRDYFDGDVSRHSHFVCRECSEILDIFSDYSEYLNSDAKDKTGAQIECYSLVFHGVCRKCSENL